MCTNDIFESSLFSFIMGIEVSKSLLNNLRIIYFMCKVWKYLKNQIISIVYDLSNGVLLIY